MQRFALRDDQWERIKDFLPGREGHVGGTARTTDYSFTLFFTDIELEFPGVIYRRVSVTGTIVHQRFSRRAKSGVFER